jgi:putative RecB family exonuclease
MAPGETKYYPTQLETFVECPFKYRCSKDPEIKRKHRKPTAQQYLGTCIHDALEAFFDIRRTPVAARAPEKLAELFRRAWAGVDLPSWKKRDREEERRRVFAGDREHEASWGRQGLHLLDRFFRTADQTVIPYTAEQFHEAKLSSGAILAGKVDRIDKLADGSLEVVDYKTGKVPPRRDDASVAEDDLQLSAYAIVISRKYGLAVSRCSLIFLTEDLKIGFTPTPELLAKKEARIEEIVRAIEAETEFAPRKNNLCPWCEYREICPVGKEIPGADQVAERPDVPF